MSRTRMLIAMALGLAGLLVLATGFSAAIILFGILDGPALSAAAILAPLLSVASMIVGLALLASERAQSAETARALARRTNETREFLARVRASALESERAGRRLAARIGDTLGGLARIASEATTAYGRAMGLSSEVADGASAMEEIQASVESLARQIGSQKDLVDQSAAAVEQMTASIESVAGVARTKRTAAERLAELTRKGADTLAVSERLIGEVNESVDQVTNMIRVINSIAAQTNLLAMNAAIEAAHAGAYGRGFAVVAAEIRSLAESTSTNAGTIGKTLSELASKIADAQSASSQSGETFRTIQDESRSVSAAFDEITVSTEELAAGSSEITEATSRLRDIASQTTTSSEEMRIGANEVTSILTSTRETSRENAEAMDAIGSASRSVSSASSQISAQSVENNGRIVDLLSIVDGGSEDGKATAAEAQKRLHLANQVLNHFSWMGLLRALIDGETTTEKGVPGAVECETGRWLEGEAAQTITDVAALERLRRAHAAFHDAAERIVDLKADGGEPVPLEQAFSRLLESARTISEILSSYEEEAVSWTPELSVGVEVFDAHHRRLFSLVNKLYDVMRSGSQKSTLEEVFDELLEYAVYHFGAEEKAFDLSGYPGADAHRATHAELVAKAGALRNDLDEGRPMIAVDVMVFLRDWVTSHILGEDKRYTEFFQTRAVDELLRTGTTEVSNERSTT
ncbi:MAG: bacteriohemerythrin [Spirochaetota bacterium]